MIERIHKYPRTQHIEGSRLQEGDEDLSQVPFADIRGLNLVVEEKVDGANCGVSFDATYQLQLQSRGHFLVGGPRERHFSPLKGWVRTIEPQLLDVLEDRYVMYAEWLYAKHTVFYDLLPHYFMEFDVLDTKTGHFLSTPKRRELLRGLNIEHVKVLHEGPIWELEDLTSLAGHSYFKSGLWRKRLADRARDLGLDVERVVGQTDDRDEMEGLYMKVEDDDRVISRLKWVRHSFTSSISDSDTHWLDRPILPNMLGPGVML